MDSNVKKDVELAKKSCDKSLEIIKSKRHAAFALLVSIGICLTLVVVTFALGSLFGYYLANLQMLQIEQKVEILKEGNIETNHTIGGMHKLAQQFEHKVTDNQTTISATTQISTTTRTDEDLLYFKISFALEENEEAEKENVDLKKDQMDEIIPICNKIFDTLESLEPRGFLEPSEPDTQPISSTTSTATDKDLTGSKISFDTEENDETEKSNVDPKEDNIDEKIPNWNEIFNTLETLEPREPSEPDYDDTQSISTTTTNPEDLSQTEFVEDEFISLHPVFKATAKSDEPEDYDDESYDDDDEDDDAVQETVSLDPNETIAQIPITPRQPLRIDNSLSTALLAKYKHFEHNIHRCSFKLSRKCSAPEERKIINEQKNEIWSILLGDIPVNESKAQYITRIQNLTHQLDAAIERFASTRVDLCAGDDDYECQNCVKRNANCYFTNGDTCNTPVEWNIIGYIPRMTIADIDLCYHNPLL